MKVSEPRLGESGATQSRPKVGAAGEGLKVRSVVLVCLRCVAEVDGLRGHQTSRRRKAKGQNGCLDPTQALL